MSWRGAALITGGTLLAAGTLLDITLWLPGAALVALSLMRRR